MARSRWGQGDRRGHDATGRAAWQRGLKAVPVGGGCKMPRRWRRFRLTAPPGHAHDGRTDPALDPTVAPRPVPPGTLPRLASSEVVVMAQQVKSVADWMAERAVSPAQLVAASGLDRRVVEAIAQGRYTPQPGTAPAPGGRPGGRPGAGRVGAPDARRARVRPRPAVRPQPLRRTKPSAEAARAACPLSRLCLPLSRPASLASS
jgi:hypothetical protein